MTGPVPAHGTGSNPYEPQPYPQSAPAPAPAYREVSPDDYARLREQQQRPALPALAPPAAVDEPAPPAEDPEQHLDDLRAEVDTERARDADPDKPERDIPDGAVAVPLEGRNGRDVIHILDPQDWSTAANGDLRVGDFESWAAECLAPGEYEDVWQQLDPTLRHVNEMFKEWRRLTGNDRGKSPRSMSGYRRSARR